MDISEARRAVKDGMYVCTRPNQGALTGAGPELEGKKW